MEHFRRDYLVQLAVNYEGDWIKMYNAILQKEKIEINPFLYDMIDSEVITILDEDYPKELEHTFEPPLVLFYHGDISLIKDINSTISIIGTRDPSEYGIEVTNQIVKEVAKSKITISGLAMGIDTIVHRVTLENNGKTVAVLGGGINNLYPQDNLDLYNIIKEKGLVISEYPNMSLPKPDNFRMRNRIIAGLSNNLLVTEARGYKSGTLITIRHALNLGKNVMCVPERINKESICNRMIKEGAFLVENAEEVLDITR